MAEPELGVEETIVWRVQRGMRIFAIGAIVVFALLIMQVAMVWGYYATIGILLVLGVLFQVYWQLLRPKLTATEAGVDVVSDWKPVHLEWADIRRVEIGDKGLTLIRADGSAVHSKVPHAAKPNPDKSPTEQALAADYLTRRANWARKGTGIKPTYEAPKA
ncbi:hypothetical protein GCM10009682_14900 [Luedemannella flava]|uniref:Uncharacterized protein n=1 Tax=Luedemannella flava TaxID=349316 RepID=A0ABP4XV60_9ACTN